MASIVGGVAEARRTAHRSDFDAQPLTSPEAIPPPTRIWTDEEMGRIRLGFFPVCDDRWFMFMEGDRLFFHRGAGPGIYEATFSPVDGGYIISSAVVTGYEHHYKRASDEFESALVEDLIVGHLLREPISDS